MKENSLDYEIVLLWLQDWVATCVSATLCQRQGQIHIFYDTAECIDTEGFYSHMKLAFVKITQLHI